ncbi:orotidine 5'-phosphate decarboxylase / HUMPS family protein [Frankia sp. Cr1]|uniref:orotidine 5'-phosphate decarboxylase / HUMPS family protein n=1 Tax=Frankia sp. Cr1 TaxID=3073931 RepID=UPI002AD2AEFB|nr:orotidine 5'-phosphate decarboxylase / HUMPS family protein [Frankia sp. Cr1]
MTTVRRWSGREARALREAQRMSVREFAARLGVNPAAISNWERRGDQARLRYQTQQLLDIALTRAPDDVHQRFETALADDEPTPAESDASLSPGPRVPSRHTAPDDVSSDQTVRAAIGWSSRTPTLVGAVGSAAASAMVYLPPPSALERLREFLASPSRIYLVTGPPGCGKTRLTCFLAESLAEDVDVQLHGADAWSEPVDLATKILRYASLPGGEEPLLTLEDESATLDRPLLVVIDGLKDQAQFRSIAREVDTVLRQVTHDRLRFLLVARTPPEIEVAAYPVLAASVFPAGNPGAGGASYGMSRWTTVEAQHVWDLSRLPDDPPFTALPPAIQELICLPLYMQLVRAAGGDASTGAVNGYRLVDHCARAILRGSGRDVDRSLRELSDLAEVRLPGLVPAHLVPRTDAATDAATDAVAAAAPMATAAPLVRVAPDGAVDFDHDVICEYFLATRIADLVRKRGRSVATVGAFNDLATQACTSARARSVFELAVHCLDSSTPDVLASVALSPTVTVAATLPMLLRAGAGGAAFTTAEVLRTCARRCAQDSAADLARSLLATPATLDALGGEYDPWLVGVLRRFGSAMWTDAARAVERNLNGEAVRRLLETTDLDEAEVATFFARYFFLLVSDHDLTAMLETLLGHPDWRVRAALADGLGDDLAAGSAVSQTVMARLVGDPDYKVRAALAQAIGHSGFTAAQHHVTSLIGDDNWHVRERLLRGILNGDAEVTETTLLAQATMRRLAVDESWSRAPAPLAALVDRLYLLHGSPEKDHTPARRHPALFSLLREIRTGAIRLPDGLQRSLIHEGRQSQHWLVHREAHAVSGTAAVSSGRHERSPHEEFRRLRDGRCVQIALDVHDLEHASTVARAAAAAGLDFIEVGDPLIKRVGVAAVEHIKRQVPNLTVVAEMMSADWGRDQVVLAAEAGADVVFLIGPASTASVSAAVDAGRRLGVPIVLDVPSAQAGEQWVRDMERAGVDGFAVTSNIDLGVGQRHPMANARTLRAWTRLPVAVSGGFSATDTAVMDSGDWDILIVGRSVTEALHPDAAASRLASLLRPPAKDVNDRHGP